MGFKRVGAAVLVAATLTFPLEAAISLRPITKPIITLVNKPSNQAINKSVDILIIEQLLKEINNPIKKHVEQPVIDQVKMEVSKPVKTYYKKTSEGLEISKYEYELLARVAKSEAGDECMDSQIGVINVVLNRVASSEFPNTIHGVIYQKHQFSVVANGSIDNPAESMNYEAVDRALSGENTVDNCLFFWASYLRSDHSLWDKPVIYQYDRTVFAN